MTLVIKPCQNQEGFLDAYLTETSKKLCLNKLFDTDPVELPAGIWQQATSNSYSLGKFLKEYPKEIIILPSKS